jgi:hypothetical protein
MIRKVGKYLFIVKKETPLTVSDAIELDSDTWERRKVWPRL